MCALKDNTFNILAMKNIIQDSKYYKSALNDNKKYQIVE